MRTLLAAVIGGMLVVGCGGPPAGGGGGPTPGPGGSTATASVSGDWTLVHQLSAQPGGVPTTVRGALRLAQSGTALTGTYSLEQPPTAVAVTGTVSGPSISLRIGPVTLAGGATLSLDDTLSLSATGQEASGSTVATVTLGASTLVTPGSCTMTRR